MTRAPSARPVQRAAAQSQLPIDVQGDGGAGGDRGGSGVLGFSHSVSSLMLRNRKFPMSATSKLGQSDTTSVFLWCCYHWTLVYQRKQQIVAESSGRNRPVTHAL